MVTVTTTTTLSWGFFRFLPGGALHRLPSCPFAEGYFFSMRVHCYSQSQPSLPYAVKTTHSGRTGNRHTQDREHSALGGSGFRPRPHRAEPKHTQTLQCHTKRNPNTPNQLVCCCHCCCAYLGFLLLSLVACSCVYLLMLVVVACCCCWLLWLFVVVVC